MIHHVSIPARNPKHVAEVLAELMGGRAYPFPGPLAGAWIALSGDPNGTMIEAYPEETVMAIGEGDAPVNFTTAPDDGRFFPFHVFLSVPHDRETIERIGAAAGWRTRFFGRAAPGKPPAFYLIEMWIENRVLIELAPPDLIGIYTNYMQFDSMDAMRR